MQHTMFIVEHEGKSYGPFLQSEADTFRSARGDEAEIVPLIVPAPPGEYLGPTQVQILEDDAYQAHVDSFKIDTRCTLAGVIQTIWFARRDERVLTAREMLELWRLLFQVSRAVESLMTHANLAVENPNEESLSALRKAFWRNRDSDDFDADYEHRFW